jgi:hypothetical protein
MPWNRVTIEAKPTDVSAASAASMASVIMLTFTCLGTGFY